MVQVNLLKVELQRMVTFQVQPLTHEKQEAIEAAKAVATTAEEELWKLAALHTQEENKWLSTEQQLIKQRQLHQAAERRAHKVS